MDKNIYQTNIKGHFIKSWIKFWDEDAVALEISYPYSGLSLAGETKEVQTPRELARELSQQLFDYCQFLETEMSNLKRAYFNYQKEREEWIGQDVKSGSQKWYDTYLSDLIPFNLPPYTKMEVIDYIGKYRRPAMGGMVYLNREQEMPIYYRHRQIGTRRVDFLVEGVISTELKAISALEDVHLAQAINYLEAYDLELGLLFNFGSKSLQYKRVVNRKFNQKKQGNSEVNPKASEK